MQNPEDRNIKKNLSFVIVTGVFLLFVFFNFKIDSSKKITQTENKNSSSRLTFYPKQYSDREITVNAKITDPKYKDLSFVEKNSQLSNAFSALIVRNEIPAVDNLLENGTWLWTPTLQMSEAYMSSIIKGAEDNGINSVYVSIDSYLDIFVMPNGEEKEKAKEKFDGILKDFISKANKKGIKVDAEAGWQNWAQAGNSYKANVVLDYVINFNRKNKEKFRGFQYDVEVYLLPEYFEGRQKVLSNFLNLINQTVTVLNNTDLQLSVVVPEFYDGTFSETPSFIYRGKNAYTIEHLLGVLERRSDSKIIVMSYRNYSSGKNGSIDISKDEINIANKYNTKIILAQETGDVLPPYITFHNTSRLLYNKEVELLEKKFINERSYGGIATHYVNAFLELK